MDLLIAILGGVLAGGILLAWFAVQNARAGLAGQRFGRRTPVIVYIVEAPFGSVSGAPPTCVTAVSRNIVLEG